MNIPLHHHRLLYVVGRGGTTGLNINNQQCTCPLPRLDCTFWRPSCHHFKQGLPVHICCVGLYGPAAHHPTCTDHPLPSRGQWQGGAVLPPPLPLLGICATPQEDSAITPTEVVFGSTLVLPGQIVCDSVVFLDQFLIQIKQTLSRSENLTTRYNTAAAGVNPTELLAALLIAPYCCQDGHMPPFAPLYYGPYAVLHWPTQHFTIQMNAKEEVMSTGRLKPCLTPGATPVQPQ